MGEWYGGGTLQRGEKSLSGTIFRVEVKSNGLVFCGIKCSSNFELGTSSEAVGKKERRDPKFQNADRGFFLD